MMEKSDRLFWIWLSKRLGAGNRLYPTLLERFGSPYEVFEARETELSEAIPGLTAAQLAALCDKRLDDIFKIDDYCRANEYEVLLYNDRRYPLSYRSLTDPPLLLYYRGTLPDFQHRLCIAMVGTRRMSEYGRRIAYKIAYELAAAGVVVVSGMALGVDSVASCAALQAGGDTVAILGSGVDVPYPREHEDFMKILTERAVVMSEFAPGSEPQASHFPIRNRLISGLCQGTLVIEAAEGSGALITADRALQQGRELFAVPANVGDANAGGTNRLIRDGAHVVLCADDILKHYRFLYKDAVLGPGSAALGKRSDYDGSVLDRMGVYSRVVGGYTKIPAAEAGSAFRKKSVQGTNPSESPDAGSERTKSHKPSVRRKKVTAEIVPSTDIEAPVQTQNTDPRLSPKDTQAKGDRSCELVAGLNDVQKAVLDAIPADVPVGVDRLQHLGYSVGQLLTALSVLEIKGLIHTLPGGLYSRD